MKSLSWIIVEKVTRMILGFTVGAVVARHLGPFNYGILNYFLSIIGMLSTVVLFGLKDLLIKRFKIYNYPSVFGAGFSISMIISIIISLTVLAMPVAPEIVYLLPIILFKPFDHFLAFYEANNRFNRVSIIMIIGALTAALLKIMAVRFSLDLTFFLKIYSIESLVIATCIMLGILFCREEKNIFTKIEYLDLKYLFQKGINLVLIFGVISVYMRLDQMMLGYFGFNEELGFYSAAVRIAELGYFVPIAFLTSVYPNLIKLRGFRFHYYLYWVLRIIALLNMLYITFVLLFSGLLITLIYGVNYDQSIVLLKISVFNFIFASLGIVSNKYYVIQGISNRLWINAVAGLIINLVFNALFIPLYGATGAAVVSLASLLISNLLMDLYWRESRVLFYLKIRSFLNFKFSTLIPTYMNFKQLN